jgi:hypothetical protein
MFVALLAAVAVFALSVVPVAGANVCATSCGPAASVKIGPTAYFIQNLIGPASINVIITYKCTGGLGDLSLFVFQSADQTTTGDNASGFSDYLVACNGLQHTQAFSIPADGINLGCADVDAFLYPPLSIIGYEDYATVQIVP